MIFGEEASIGDEHFWQKEQQLEIREMGMNLASSRSRKKLHVTGMEQMKERLEWQSTLHLTTSTSLTDKQTTGKDPMSSLQSKPFKEALQRSGSSHFYICFLLIRQRLNVTKGSASSAPACFKGGSKQKKRNSRHYTK